MFFVLVVNQVLNYFVELNTNQPKRSQIKTFSSQKQFGSYNEHANCNCKKLIQINKEKMHDYVYLEALLHSVLFVHKI